MSNVRFAHEIEMKKLELLGGLQIQIMSPTIMDNEQLLVVIESPMYFDNTSGRGNEVSSGDSDPSLSKVYSDLCYACRTGDVDTVDVLLSTPNLDVNKVDEYDYSPLILASLCGHKKVVELLLSRGAVCDRHTYQGARCIYGALNDSIRNILVSFTISKKVNVDQPFASHISSLLNPLMELSSKDVVFHFPHVNGASQCFLLNRYILAARSSYFCKLLSPGGDWHEKTVIEVPESYDPEIFKIIIDYLYLRTDGIPIDQARTRKALIEIATTLELADLLEAIDSIKEVVDEKEKAAVKNDSSLKFMEYAKRNLEKFYRENILSNKISVPVEAEEDVDFEDIDTSKYLNDEHKTKLLESDAFADAIVSLIDVESGCIFYYPVQKSILARSEYFDTMFKSDLFLSSHGDIPVFKHEDKTQNQKVVDRPAFTVDDIPVLQLATTSTTYKVAEMILSYFYYDEVPQIPLELTMELLFAADELLLEKLKTMCAVNITYTFSKFTYSEFETFETLTGYNAYDLIRVAWQTRCDRLEQHIIKFIAYNLPRLYDSKEERESLLQLIHESSGRIKDRQDTDTIELVDDIRYFLSKKYAVNDVATDFEPMGATFRAADAKNLEVDDIRVFKNSMIQFESDIELIDSLLDELDLEA